MNEVARVGNNSVATADDYNPFASYGEQATRKTIVGQLLKFTKGDYLAGQDGELIAEGTKFVANMDQLLLGWIRWSNSKPQEHVMGPLSEGFQVPKRETLGRLDETQWDVDTNGKPSDPWQETNYLLLKSVKTEEGDDGLYTFTSSSRGGLGAIAELCKAYGKLMRSHPNEYPVISLQVRKYKHDTYGWIKTPSFDLAGWAPKSTFDGALDEAKAEEPASAGSTGTKTQF